MRRTSPDGFTRSHKHIQGAQALAAVTVSKRAAGNALHRAYLMLRWLLQKSFATSAPPPTGSRSIICHEQ